MIEKEKEVSGKYRLDLSWMMYIPLVVLLGIVPLIVRLVKVDIPEAYILYITGNNVDMFSQAKATIIFCIMGAMVVTLFLAFNKSWIKQGVESKIYYSAAGVYVLTTLIAMWMSDYGHVAKWGLPNRAEGGIMLVCYVAMMLYAYWVIKEQKSVKYIVIPLAFTVVITTILGYFQYIGKDLFLTQEWGKQLVVPEYYAEDRELLSAIYQDSNMYTTMMHYNYVGSFSAMMLPLFTTLTLFIKNYKIKIATGFISLCSVFLLFGSTSRAGLIGIACSVLIFLLVFLRYFFKKWKIMLAVIGLAVVSIVGLDTATGGKIFSRIPMLLGDLVALAQPVDENFDYKAGLPIQGVTQVDGDILIQLPADQIRVTTGEEGLEFYNAKGEQVVYIYFEMGPDQTRYFTQEVAYEPLVFQLEIKEDRRYVQVYWNHEYIVDIDITGDALQLVERFNKQPLVLEDAARIGFVGKEKIGSARGYIWSRSLPLLAETFLIGTGPDTYAFEFPQYDIFGKWHAYGTPNMIVDKPHNLYLQIAINQGGIALLAFLILVGTYLVQGLRVYAFKKDYTNMQIIGIAVMLAIVGYLGAGLFNDSVVSVAPIFWILLGTGMAINHLVAGQNRTNEKQKPHATIHMKTRKHV